MVTRRARAFVSGALLTVVIGCSDGGLNPFDIGDLYVLRTVGGEPLPAIVNQVGGVTLRVAGDTLRLRPNGTGIRSLVQLLEPATSDAPETVRSSSSFTYVIAGDDLRIDFACPPEASCIRGPHIVGRLDGDLLVAEHQRFPHLTQIYERVTR
jgi:hypothetical protein